MIRALIPALFAALLLVSNPASAETPTTIPDAVATALTRLIEQHSPEELERLTADEVEAALTDTERELFATRHVSFTVNVPAEVFVYQETRFDESEPFWLQQRGFELTDHVVMRDSDRFRVWRKAFDAGEVGLGINAFHRSGRHYFVSVTPQDPAATLEISNLYPGYLEVERFDEGARVYLEETFGRASVVPPALRGHAVIVMDNNRTNAVQLTSVYRQTRHPAQDKPDQLLLTWSDEPTTTQTIQWRTSTAIEQGGVRYMKKSAYHNFDRPEPTEVAADTRVLETPRNTNDPVVHRHTAVLRDLEPDTEYVYSVGDDTGGWTELAEFRTAPGRVQPFSFIYMGDVQNGMDRWQSVVHDAFRERPDAAFYLLAGDLVNRGNDRDDWDDFFHAAEGVFNRRPLVPLLGNHEYHGGPPDLYHDLLTLPTNGPDTIPPERAYHFEYGNALFVILDSMLPPELQSEWLDEVLGASNATWKFVSYHHPAYSTGRWRDNPHIREHWVPIIDKHGVDFVFQGHDHVYQRTYPMRNNQRVATAAEGTYYVIAVAGTKMYSIDREHPAPVVLTNTITWQVIDIQLQGNRLVYRAYDLDQNLVDEVIIEK